MSHGIAHMTKVLQVLQIGFKRCDVPQKIKCFCKKQKRKKLRRNDLQELFIFIKNHIQPYFLKRQLQIQ
jgi:hypothetical protein